jgi:LCP family protein required for cell wall assembly
VGFYIHKYNTKMDEITEVRTQYTQVEIYVKDDNRAQTIEYAVESQYRFGTIAYTDVEAINQTKEELERKYGREIRILNYATLLDLVKALDNGEVDALMISSAYIPLIDGLAGYEHYATSLRTLHSTNVQTEIAVPPAPVKPEEVEEEDLTGTLRDPALWEHSFTAYISGIDTYGPVTTRSRSDVNIIAIVNTETKTVLLVSTPRDFYVPFNFAPANGAMDKLTHAGIYGIECSMQALGDYFELPITYYLRVNFTGFIDVIDSLGGVDVESDADFGAHGYYFQKGMNHLDGKAALRFVRDRYSFLDGDRARGRHQMAVIKGVINGLASSKLVTNYSEIMDEMAGCFQTNASKALIGELAQLTLDRSKGDWTVLTYSVNGWGNEDYAFALGCYAYVMVPYPDTIEYARELMMTVASDKPLTQEQINENMPKH